MDDPSRPSQPDADAATGGGTRATSRDSLFLMARMLLPGDRVAREVRVRNLSEGGLMVESERPLLPGTAVTMTLRGVGEVTGQVAWYAAGRCGIAFDAPIDPMLARKPVGNGTMTPVYTKAITR